MQKNADIEAGVVGISSNMMVKRWIEEWLETYKKPVVTEKSYKNYLTHTKFINNHIGHLRISQVTDTHLQKILNLRADYSYSDIKHMNDTLKAIFKKARQSGLISKDPSETLEKPKAKKGKGRAITEFERKHILEVAEMHPAGLMFLTMLYTGLRPGELCALDWRHIDFKKSQIKVEQVIESGTNRIKETKTESGDRTVPIRPELYEKLWAVKDEPFEPVFKQLTTARRHTGTSRQKAGIPLNYIKTLMGHSDISVTSGTYIHTEDEIIKDCFDSVFSGEKCGERNLKSGKYA